MTTKTFARSILGLGALVLFISWVKGIFEWAYALHNHTGPALTFFSFIAFLSGFAVIIALAICIGAFVAWLFEEAEF